MANLEIERRYLFNSCNIHKLLKKRGISYIITKIEQFYLKANSEETLRYRKEEDKYIKNIKKGKGLVREEFEEEVSKLAYKKAKLDNSGGVIKKDRIKFFINSNKFELDIFKGKLKGLSILEIEFDNLKEANEFKIPKFLKKYIIKEITNENIYSNGALSRSMQIPLRDDSYISLKEILTSKEKLKKAKFDLYISEYESTKIALENYINRFSKAYEFNYNNFLKSNDINDLKLVIKSIKRLKSLLYAFREYIERDKYIEIFFNINNFLIDLEEIQNLDFTFRKLLKNKDRFSIENQTQILKILIKIAQDLKIKKIELKKSYNTTNLKYMINLFDNLKLNKKLNIPFVYAREVILNKIVKKIKKIDNKDIENINSHLELINNLLKLFNNSFKDKNYKQTKISIKNLNLLNILNKKLEDEKLKKLIIKRFTKKIKQSFKLPIKKYQKRICNAN